jgi:hypothetical protein
MKEVALGVEREIEERREKPSPKTPLISSVKGTSIWFTRAGGGLKGVPVQRSI